MKECIAKLLREDKLCSVFTNDAEKFMAGYLLDSDGEYMLMELFNPYGIRTVCAANASKASQKSKRIRSITRI